MNLRGFLWRNRDISHLMSVSERPGIFCKSGILLILVMEQGWDGGAMSATVRGKVTVKKPKNTSSATRHRQRQPLTVMRCDMTWYEDSGASSLWSSPQTHILGWTMRKISNSRERLQKSSRKWGGHTLAATQTSHSSLTLHPLGHIAVCLLICQQGDKISWNSSLSGSSFPSAFSVLPP